MNRPRRTAPRSGAASPAPDEATRPKGRAATEERILAAVGTVLARDGFAAIGVNALAREAGVDKVLIYRYFGGLPELIEAWGRTGRFWPSVDDLLHRNPKLLQRPEAERYAAFFEHFIDELRQRPMTLEILAAELAHRNELTAVLEAQRESWGEAVGSALGGAAYKNKPQLRAITVLLVAGVQYLLLRARSIRQFGGIDLQSDTGWDEIKSAIRLLSQQLLTDTPPAAAE